MRPENLRVLAERASGVDGHPERRLEEVHARVARARRRRQYGAVVAAVLAVVLALSAGAGLLALVEPDRTGPAKPAPLPTPTPTPTRLEVKHPSVRRVTYAEGHTIHWGDRAIDGGGTVVQVAALDDGVVFVRDSSRKHGCLYADLCRTLWFTDGADTFSLGAVTGSVIRGFDVEFSNAGDTVLWSAPDPGDHSQYYPRRLEYVVYDTGQRHEVGRFGSYRSEILAVLDDYVYWVPGRSWCLDFSHYYGTCRRYRGAMRFDLSTGHQQRVSWSSYRADRGSRPRTFVTPFMGEGGVPEPVLSGGIGLEAHGHTLVPDDGNGPPIVARLASTREVVRLRLPAGYRNDTNLYWTAGWLDDTHVIVRADNEDDLLVCPLPDGRCRVAVRGAPVWGFSGRG